jgi:hypothetical protein
VAHTETGHLRDPMSKVQQGLVEAVTSLLGGFLLTILIDSLARDNSIPVYFVWLFGVFNILFNLATLNSYRRVSLLYTIGWLAGSVFMFDMLSPLDIALNIACPVVIIILKCWYWIKNSIDSY